MQVEFDVDDDLNMADVEDGNEDDLEDIDHDDDDEEDDFGSYKQNQHYTKTTLVSNNTVQKSNTNVPTKQRYDMPIGPLPQQVTNDLKSLDEMVRELVAE